MKAAISFLLQSAILCGIGWAIYRFFGLQVAFSVLCAYIVLWLLGLRNRTEARLDLIEQMIVSLMAQGK